MKSIGHLMILSTDNAEAKMAFDKLRMTGGVDGVEMRELAGG
jgi:hypothetical protein